MKDRQVRRPASVRNREDLDAMAARSGERVLLFVSPCCGTGMKLSYQKGSGIVRATCAKCGAALAGLLIEHRREAAG